MFKRVTLQGWRQFREVDISFHPRLTVLTGANGAGKTTVLNLISRHFGWGSSFISTPLKRREGPGILYSADFWALGDSVFNAEPDPESPKIGSIEYSDGEASIAMPPGKVGWNYDLHVIGQRHVEGLHIPSHRATYSYQQVQNIPTIPRRRNEVFNHYLSLIRTRFGGGHTQWSPQYYMKETLIALATFGYGNQAVEADPESAKIFEEFQEVLRRMLPPKLGFRKLAVRVPEVVLETDSGNFSIDALSGGAAAVIDLAWQIFMYQPAGSQFVVSLDEPENHLHPELQRRVLADLISAFPTVQFVVATHSPFIVGSVPDSNVYILDYDDTNRVVSTRLDTVNRAGSANEILRDVLGLEYTLPVWVEDRLQSIVDKYSERNFTEETLAELRGEMNALGLGKHTPEAISKLADRKDAE